MLLAMATGTGKTKTCIALIYRLLKARRFRRVLFLVDRSALGEQAANAFKDTRMENLQTFADIFGIKELDGPSPIPTPRCTSPPCRAWSSACWPRARTIPRPRWTPMTASSWTNATAAICSTASCPTPSWDFRGYEDYISKYRRVLDYFDAVKIGLTATPALHTTEIFGPPIYVYSYREAVIDGYLVDHEPPVQIHTELSSTGIRWKVGDEVQVWDPRRQQIDLFTTPDEIQFEVDALQPQGHHRILQPRGLRLSGRGAGPRLAPEDPDLLRHRRPCRPGGGPAQDAPSATATAAWRTTPSSRSPAPPTGRSS